MSWLKVSLSLLGLLCGAGALYFNVALSQRFGGLMVAGLLVTGAGLIMVGIWCDTFTRKRRDSSRPG